MVCCFREEFREALTDILEAPQPAVDPCVYSFAARYEHRQVLMADLKQRSLTATTEQWLDRPCGKVACAPGITVRRAPNDEQVLARDMLVEVEQPELGTLREAHTAARVMDRVAYHRQASALGADNEAILSRLLGHSRERVTAPRQDGVT